MRIVTVLGTRPEIIRLSRVIPLLDAASEHVFVHTGQNFDDSLNGVFFRELGVRTPDVFLNVKAETASAQIAQILVGIERVFLAQRPDRVLILGDTNSGLSSLVASRLGIPVFHMEAGNRCFDFRVPEEVNRRVIDHTSTVLLPYTERSRQHLLREGIATERIHVTGNPIKEVMDHYRAEIGRSDVLSRLALEPGKFFLVTMHRAENVDIHSRLRNLLQALSDLHSQYGFPVVCSLHPRTRSRAAAFGLELDAPGLKFVEPLGFFDFIHLEKSAFCLLTDSGTVQEEACILHIPNATIRDVTERPETLECGSNVLAGCDPAAIAAAVRQVTGVPPAWVPPAEYLAPYVSRTVCNILVGPNPWQAVAGKA